jgi:hypothetical protein
MPVLTRSLQVTLLAIRAVRDQMYIGIRESQVRHMMENALSTAGLQDLFALVLFGGDFYNSDLLYVVPKKHFLQRMLRFLMEVERTVP